jgi:hypothetical protein
MNTEQSMNELDNDQFARNLLGRLAATMPDNPGRAAAVQRGVRRRHRRRVATRASVGLTFAAGVGLVMVEARRPQTLQSAPAAPTDAKSPDTVAGKVTVEADDPCADVASRSDRPTDEGRLKATGTITAVNGDTISVAVEESQVPMANVTATIAADATYVDAGQPATTRPTLAIGDHVAFGAVEQPDGSYTIDTLEAHAPDAGQDAEAKQSSAASDAVIEEAKRQHAIAVCAGAAG